ncbi:MAG: undecaprenyl-diphosphate phosphatase [Nocardiopsis sp. BM-2018]|nr:MAG: undecaprenyl-diphosphate phosphatase [Nocardiopsis sp. BM-2018]
MDVLQATILGIVQGLTEFLPVSSSGHLALATYHFGWGEGLPLWVGVATNTGTLLAVLVYLRRDVTTALLGFLRGLTSADARHEEGWRIALLVLVGSVPTVVIGLALRPVFETLGQALPVALALAVTGLVLWTAPRGGAKAAPHQLTFRDALLAGVAQGLAVIPGISRSGATIAMLLWRGASAETAPRLSFLMYLVVSVGVAVLEADTVIGEQVAWGALVAMTVASFVVGYLALLVLFAVLRRGRFRVFAPYLWAIAAFTLVRVALS